MLERRSLNFKGKMITLELLKGAEGTTCRDHALSGAKVSVRANYSDLWPGQEQDKVLR
ncbi:MAG: hypothetical protein JRH06_17545 [Deltaproteobacteria bacterium]|nr:hypothetical protein [Deltaproteobacteria bacterium]